MTFLSFNDFLLEKRKNQILNVKYSVVDQLQVYKDEPDIFISFTEIEKVGIKPFSSFNTPNGIYTYPIREIWKDIENNTIPFASERPFVYVLRAKKIERYIDGLTKYSENDLKKDIELLKKHYQSKMPAIHMNLIVGVAEEYASVLNKKTTFIRFWNITRFLAFILSRSYNLSNTGNKKISNEKILDFLEKEYSKLHKEEFNGKSHSQMWNNILRKLNYKWICDRTGERIIHPAEPFQAVFLSKDTFEVVELVNNIRPKKHYTNIKSILEGLKNNDINLKRKIGVYLGEDSLQKEKYGTWNKIKKRPDIPFIIPPFENFKNSSENEILELLTYDEKLRTINSPAFLFKYDMFNKLNLSNDFLEKWIIEVIRKSTIFREEKNNIKNGDIEAIDYVMDDTFRSSIKYFNLGSFVTEEKLKKIISVEASR